VWAGKDVANSETARNIYLPHSLQQAILTKKW